MNTSKKYLDSLAKSLYKKSLTGGNVDEKKVRAILKEISTQKISKITTVLKTYKRLLEEKISKEELIIETNDKITLPKKVEDELKKKTGVKRIINKTNKDIVFGTKITHGDWVFENTLESKLQNIIKNI